MSAKTKPTRVVGYSPHGHMPGRIEPFDELFTHKKNITDQDGLKDIDCLLLWGGTDIWPGYYREKAGRHTFPGFFAHPSPRDELEWKAMLYCKANNIPIIGVCRGAQIICAFAGGSLVQHVEGHQFDHMIETKDDGKVWTTSSHHQMMNPYKVPHVLLAWSSPAQSKVYLDGRDNQISEMEQVHEPEIVYFPKIRALAIQGHPEYASATQGFKKLSVNLVRKYLFKEDVK